MDISWLVKDSNFENKIDKIDDFRIENIHLVGSLLENNNDFSNMLYPPRHENNQRVVNEKISKTSEQDLSITRMSNESEHEKYMIMMSLQQQQQHNLQLQKALEKRQEIEREIQSLYAGNVAIPFPKMITSTAHNSRHNTLSAAQGSLIQYDDKISPISVAKALSPHGQMPTHHQLNMQQMQQLSQPQMSRQLAPYSQQQLPHSLSQQQLQQQQQQQPIQYNRFGMQNLQVPPPYPQFQQFHDMNGSTPRHFQDNPSGTPRSAPFLQQQQQQHVGSYQQSPRGAQQQFVNNSPHNNFVPQSPRDLMHLHNAGIDVTRQRLLTPPSPPTHSGSGGRTSPYLSAPAQYGSQNSNATQQVTNSVDNTSTVFTGIVYQVQFKHCMRDMVPGPNISLPLSLGDFVMTECERGEDIGVVVEAMSMKAFVDKRYQAKLTHTDDEDSTVGRIVRLAGALERQKLPEKLHDEQAVYQYACHLAHNTFNLPMNVIDAEYQYDRMKLTVYYTSDARIDFRELVRDLFSAFKTRIWMKKINGNRAFVPQPIAAMQLSTGSLCSQF